MKQLALTLCILAGCVLLLCIQGCSGKSNGTTTTATTRQINNKVAQGKPVPVAITGRSRGTKSPAAPVTSAKGLSASKQVNGLAVSPHKIETGTASLATTVTVPSTKKVSKQTAQQVSKQVAKHTVSKVTTISKASKSSVRKASTSASSGANQSSSTNQLSTGATPEATSARSTKNKSTLDSKLDDAWEGGLQIIIPTKKPKQVPSIKPSVAPKQVGYKKVVPKKIVPKKVVPKQVVPKKVVPKQRAAAHKQPQQQQRKQQPQRPTSSPKPPANDTEDSEGSISMSMADFRNLFKEIYKSLRNKGMVTSAASGDAKQKGQDYSGSSRSAPAKNSKQLATSQRQQVKPTASLKKSVKPKIPPVQGSVEGRAMIKGDSSQVKPKSATKGGTKQRSQSELGNAPKQVIIIEQKSTKSLKPINSINDLTTPKVELSPHEFKDLIEETFKLIMQNQNLYSARANQGRSKLTLDQVIASFDERPEKPIPLEKQNLDSVLGKDSVLVAQLVEKKPKGFMSKMKTLLSGGKSGFENLVSEQVGLAVPTKMLEKGETSVIKASVKQFIDHMETQRAEGKLGFVPTSKAAAQEPASLPAPILPMKIIKPGGGTNQKQQVALVSQAIISAGGAGANTPIGKKNLQLIKENLDLLLSLSTNKDVLNSKEFTRILKALKINLKSVNLS